MDAEPAAHSLTRHADAFERIEHLAYAAIGILLCIAAAIALAGTVWVLAHDIQDWGNPALIVEVIERLLFVLMLVEILHTVRASLRHGGLRAEPFLIVGIIASIRRVLVSTLQTSTGQESAGAFRDSLLELAVLGFLILVMVASIYMLRRREHPSES